MYVIAAPDTRKPALTCGPRKEGRNLSSASNRTIVRHQPPVNSLSPRTPRRAVSGRHTDAETTIQALLGGALNDLFCQARPGRDRRCRLLNRPRPYDVLSSTGLPETSGRLPHRRRRRLRDHGKSIREPPHCFLNLIGASHASQRPSLSHSSRCPFARCRACRRCPPTTAWSIRLRIVALDRPWRCHSAPSARTSRPSRPLAGRPR